MELEEALLLFEEIQKEGADTSEMQQLLVIYFLSDKLLVVRNHQMVVGGG
jgi:hypothetical protein